MDQLGCKADVEILQPFRGKLRSFFNGKGVFLRFEVESPKGLGEKG